MFPKYHKTLEKIKKYSIDPIEINSKIEPRLITKTKSNLSELKLSYQTIQSLSVYENIVYSFQSGDSHIWFANTKNNLKVVIKMNPYNILYEHELYMLNYLQDEKFIPKIIDSWSYPSENFIVISYEGISLNELYIKQHFATNDILNQINNIKTRLNDLKLIHLDAHEGNYLIDDYGKVSLIDFEHLIPIDRTNLSLNYIKHIEDYFPNESENC